jgi:hypothetical protein
MRSPDDRLNSLPIMQPRSVAAPGIGFKDGPVALGGYALDVLET